MVQKFNDSEVGKQDIVDSPDVTASEPLHEAVEVELEPISEPVDEAVHSEKDERNARIVSKNLSKLLDDVSEDETDAINDVALMLFRSLRGMSTAGRILSGVAVIGCISIPFIPRLLNRFRSGSEPVQSMEDTINGNN